MKRILTGLQPTGVIHIGNYIGSIKQMIKYAEEYESIIFIADMHAITVPQDSNELRNKIRSLLALYLACGVDPKNNKIFIQSENEYHANISWLLECNTYFGELSRMIQFKEKSKNSDNFTCGLLTYPVLMAADILTYDTDYVPVGMDQKQHVEIARDIAERFNKKYGDTFTIPEPLIPKLGAKIMDLQDPTKKMSKSSENQKGVINLLDDLDTIEKKVMASVTDSESIVRFNEKEKPGISNLITIYSSFSGLSIKEIEEKYTNCNYGVFKKDLAEILKKEIGIIQDKYKDIINSDYIDKLLDDSIGNLRKIAKEKFELMKSKMGLNRSNS